MPEYKYKVLRFDVQYDSSHLLNIQHLVANMEQELNKRGKEGWRVVSALPAQQPAPPAPATFVVVLER